MRRDVRESRIVSHQIIHHSNGKWFVIGYIVRGRNRHNGFKKSESEQYRVRKINLSIIGTVMVRLLNVYQLCNINGDGDGLDFSRRAILKRLFLLLYFLVMLGRWQNKPFVQVAAKKINPHSRWEPSRGAIGPPGWCLLLKWGNNNHNSSNNDGLVAVNLKKKTVG